MSPHLPLAERVRRGIVQRLGGPGGGGGVRPARYLNAGDPLARQHLARLHHFQRPAVAMRREYAGVFEELDHNGLPLVMPPAVPLLRV